MKISKIMLWVLMPIVMLTMTVPAVAEEGDVTLNPGYVSGSVSITGHQITYLTIRALDSEKVYSATTTVSVPAGADSIDYVLTVEGDRDYYLIAEATVSAPDYTRAILPLAGSVTVPIYANPGDEVPLDMSMDPAFISGTISTLTDNNNTIEDIYVRARIYVPELNQSFYNSTSASSLSEPGIPGRDYTFLVAPGLEYYWYANATIDDISYRSNTETITAPAAGITLDRDFTVDVTAATISGTALLEGINVYSASVYGNAYPPSRNNSTNIADVSTGEYTLDVDAGTWNLRPTFYYNLPGDLNHLTGYLRGAYTAVPDINNGEDRTGIDFIVDPGFISGTLSLWGANTNFSSARVQALAYSPYAYSYSYVDPDTGEFLYVCSPGDWQSDRSQNMYFDYPDDPDSSLWSYVYQYFQDTANLQTVTAGQTVPGVDLTYGTITVRRYFYVAGDGTLSRPYIRATRSQSPFSAAYGYGSDSLVTEGQAIVTLLLPGTYAIEGFANVGESNTEFGTVTVEVEEGDIVVIGGTARPTIKVTNPTEAEIICGDKVTVEGTATDDVGVASITINGEDVAFSSTGNPNDPNEVGFSHEISLNVDEENTITVTVSDVDQTVPVTLSMIVYSESCGPDVIECAVDIKPGSCPNPLNVNSKGVLLVAILGTVDFDVTTIDLNTVRLLDVAPVKSNYEDVGTPFYPFIGKEDKLDCTEEGADGIDDLTLKFDRQQIIQAIEASGEEIVDGNVITLPLTGNLLVDFGGNVISGEDVIIILEKGK